MTKQSNILSPVSTPSAPRIRCQMGTQDFRSPSRARQTHAQTLSDTHPTLPLSFRAAAMVAASTATPPPARFRRVLFVQGPQGPRPTNAHVRPSRRSPDRLRATVPDDKRKLVALRALCATRRSGSICDVLRVRLRQLGPHPVCVQEWKAGWTRIVESGIMNMRRALSDRRTVFVS